MTGALLTAMTLGADLKVSAVEYKGEGFRDPFKSLVEKKAPVTSNKQLVSQVHFDKSQYKLQGILWSLKRPQVLLNGQILDIGDSILGAQIKLIDRDGVTLTAQGQEFRIVMEKSDSTQDTSTQYNPTHGTLNSL